MDQRKIGWIGAIAGLTLGTIGAVVGVWMWKTAHVPNMDPGAVRALIWIGVSAGVVLGLLGVLAGVLGIRVSIRNAKGPRERALLLKEHVLVWVLIIGLFIAIAVTPSPYDALWFVPFTIALFFRARSWNRRQSQIRDEESAER